MRTRSSTIAEKKIAAALKIESTIEVIYPVAGGQHTASEGTCGMKRNEAAPF